MDRRERTRLANEFALKLLERSIVDDRALWRFLESQGMRTREAYDEVAPYVWDIIDRLRKEVKNDA
jgi:hypothetical protein